jgi:hypothetical protein
MNEEIKLQITAYHRWLMMITWGNEFKLAMEIANQAVYDRNPQAINLIELAGGIYNTETFMKAANLLLKAIEEDAQEAGIGFENEEEHNFEHPGDYNDYKDKIDGY